MSFGVVYKITNKKTGKCYIGSTINPKKRWSIHKKRFNSSEYTFHILAKYKNKNELRKAEEYWIWRYNAIKKGYNKNKINRGLKCTYTLAIEPELAQLIEDYKLENPSMTYTDIFVRGVRLLVEEGLKDE